MLWIDYYRAEAHLFQLWQCSSTQTGQTICTLRAWAWYKWCEHAPSQAINRAALLRFMEFSNLKCFTWLVVSLSLNTTTLWHNLYLAALSLNLQNLSPYFRALHPVGHLTYYYLSEESGQEQGTTMWTHVSAPDAGIVVTITRRHYVRLH